MRAGERKRELIYATAMELFRTKGFEDTTMRGIAERAGISLGSAYHYYASKAAIVFDYYSRLQAEHEAHVESLYDEAMEVEARLVAVTKLKLELARPDRKLLIEVATALVRPGDKLSAFSEENTDIRNRSIDVFARAIEAVPLTEEQRHAFASLIWVAHLGIFLYFVHDESHEQARTFALVEDAARLLTPLLFLATTTMAAPVAEAAFAAIAKAGLLPKS